MVASDRISAFDYILPTEIPDKGAILTALSLWWFDQLADVVDNHLITADVDDYPAELRRTPTYLRGRSMLCQRLEMVPVECVARGYLTGSGFVDYTDTGADLRDSFASRASRRFAPSGADLHAGRPRQRSATTTRTSRTRPSRRRSAPTTPQRCASSPWRSTRRAVGIAAERGIIIADTKFEFGRVVGGDFILGDEVLTPDSSRFWPADDWEPGQPQPSYDKQYVRDWLRLESGWDRKSPPPPLPDDGRGRDPARATSTRTKGSPASAGPELQLRSPSKAAAPLTVT